MKWQHIMFATLFASVYICIFMLPQHIERFALSYENIVQGETWRFLTYQFAHIDTVHLLENIIGLFLLVIIVSELSIGLPLFSLSYILTGILGIFPVWFVIKATVLGASTAVYGSFGMVANEVSRVHLKSSHMLMALVAIIVFPSIFLFLSQGISHATIASFNQGIFHLSGVFVGGFLFFALKQCIPFIERKKYRCLRGIHD